MLEAGELMDACEALDHPGITPVQLRRKRQALARHMRRVERALARDLETCTQAGT